MLSYEIKAFEDLFEAQGEANNRQDRKKNHIQVELHTSDCHKLKIGMQWCFPRKKNHLKLQGKNPNPCPILTKSKSPSMKDLWEWWGGVTCFMGGASWG